MYSPNLPMKPKHLRMSKKWINLLPLYVAYISLIPACTNKPEPSKHQESKSITASAVEIKPKYVVVNSWLDDFQNFKTAIDQNDIDKQKTYFNFPLNADTTQIWFAVYDAVSEEKHPATFPSTFTENDFVKNQQAIFTTEFIKSLAQVNSMELSKKGEYMSPKIQVNNDSLSMIANYDKATETLQLSVAHPGHTDEYGNYESEGEYAVIYFFKVREHKYLLFDKILFAG
jgi:hypothetical protein